MTMPFNRSARKTRELIRIAILIVGLNAFATYQRAWLDQTLKRLSDRNWNAIQKVEAVARENAARLDRIEAKLKNLR